MRPPEDEVIRTIVGEWIHKANQDILSAEALLSHEPPLLYPSCFHSQQAAEKYLKAYLTQRQVEFPKTHSIREVLDLIKTVDDELATVLFPATALTPYGVEARYPGDIPEPSRQETEEAISLARKVRNAVMDRLGKIHKTKKSS